MYFRYGVIRSKSIKAHSIDPTNEPNNRLIAVIMQCDIEWYFYADDACVVVTDWYEATKRITLYVGYSRTFKVRLRSSIVSRIIVIARRFQEIETHLHAACLGIFRAIKVSVRLLPAIWKSSIVE